MAQPVVVVVGAGPAGVRATERLVAEGARPIVIDEGERAGGQIYRRPPAQLERPYRDLYGFEAKRAQAIHRTFDGLAGHIDYRPRSLAFAVEGRSVHVNTSGRIAQVAFDALVLATGATDRLIPLPGWTLPGVFTLGAAQIALKAQAATVGARPVLIGTGPLLLLLAYQYAKAGTMPAMVLDVAPFSARVGALPALLASRPGVLAKGAYYMARLRRLKVPVETGATPLAIHGSVRVQGVSVRLASGRTVEIACDAVGLGYGLRPETQLADLAGARLTFAGGAQQWVPETDGYGRTTVGGVYVAGDGAGILGADAAEISGRLAAIAALADAGLKQDAAEIAALQREHRRMRRFMAAMEQAFPWPAALARATADTTLVCRCEAIRASELRRSVADLDAREINRAKAFVRVGMGRCQGRYCGPAAAEILSDALGCAPEMVGRLRGQAPVKPLAIAAERAA